MREFLLLHPPSISIIQGIFVTCPPICFILGFLVLPRILNRKFDPQLGPQTGQKWEVGKSAAFPAYFYYRARDYALAIISNRFSEKKFSVPRNFLRNQISGPIVVMCWALKISEYLFFSLAALVIVGSVVESLLN